MESEVATNKLLKPSFAKVAAMAVSTEQKAMLATRHHATMDPSQFSLPIDAALARIPVQPLPAVQHLTAKTGNTDMQSLNEAVSFLHVDDRNNPPGKGSWKGTDTNRSLKVDVALEDDQTQLSNSSTKPASLDGKSVASGTTFALDEKESLRPDDSASVKAAEEEESFSGPASGAPSSRVGSEAGSRAFRDQFHEISERMVVPLNRVPVVNRFGVPGIKEEDSPGAAPSSLPVASDPSMPIDAPFRAMATPYGFAQEGPDEKLLEALESPKDRLFLLKLEQDVISFVRDSKDPILDLPPCNSFCRLLAHKLADYYYLTHFVDNAVSAVRLYRTPFCRLPPSLTSISNPPTTGNTPPPNAPAVKIMRRAGVGPFKQKTTLEGNAAASSTDASKETSDVGGDSGSDGGRNHVQSPTESTTAKEKTAMTREEREAKYKEARERIFKGFDESDVTETNTGPEEAEEPSRSSSTSGRKKTKQQKNAQDDGFEARSQFNAYYPTMQYVSPNFAGAGQDTTVYNSYGVPSTNIGTQAAFLNNRVGQHHNSSFQQMPAFGTQFQHGPQQSFTTGFNSYGQGFGQPPSLGYNQVVSGQYNPLPPQPSMAPQRSSAMSSPAMNGYAQPAQLQPQAPHSQWSQPYYQSPYQGQIAQQQSPSYQPQPQQHHNNVQPPCSIPYPYGQLPSHPGRPNYQNQHPLPGSFNRQAFNPKTQSFIPGSGFPANPTLGHGSQPYATTTSGRGQGHPHPSQAPETMPRQALHNTYPTSFTVPPPVVPISSKILTDHSTTGQSPQVQGQSSLSKWGTPSHLPPKPPPPQMPNFMDSQRSLPPNIYAAAAAQANGQNTQSIQHGVSANGSGNNLPNQNTGIKMA